MRTYMSNEEKERILHLHLVDRLTFRVVAERLCLTVNQVAGVVYKNKDNFINGHLLTKDFVFDRLVNALENLRDRGVIKHMDIIDRAKTLQ